MGLHDREYMTEDTGFSVRGWYAGLGMTAKLILVNVVVFVLWQFGADPGTALYAFMRRHFTADPEGLLRVWTLVTAAFSHQDLWHLLFNMLFLYFLAPDLERIYGRKNLLALYLLGGAVASAAHVGLMLALGRANPTLGASGAVMAVVIVAALLFPHRRIYVMGILPVPLWGLAGFFILADLLGVASTAHGGETGVANAAHLGGALVGFLFKTYDLRPFGDGAGDLGPSAWRRLRQRFRRKPRLRVLPPLEKTAAPPAPRDDGVRTIDADTSSRVDELLRKINREGLGSLSEEEQEFLKQASAKYKR